MASPGPALWSASIRPEQADAILTTFHDPAHQNMTAAAGIGAARELLALRSQLERP